MAKLDLISHDSKRKFVEIFKPTTLVCGISHEPQEQPTQTLTTNVDPLLLICVCSLLLQESRRCPRRCNKCLNQSLQPQDDVNDHIHIYGMSAAYTRWILMSTGPIFREVAGKFDLWRSRRWRSGFKSDAIRTLQPLHHCSVGYQPSTT